MVILAGLAVAGIYNVAGGKVEKKPAEQNEIPEGQYVVLGSVEGLYLEDESGEGEYMEEESDVSCWTYQELKEEGREISENLDGPRLATAVYSDVSQVMPYFEGVGYWEDDVWTVLCWPELPYNYMLTVYDLPKETMTETLGTTRDGAVIDGSITVNESIPLRVPDSPALALEVASPDGTERVSFRIIPLAEGQTYEDFIEELPFETAPLEGTGFETKYCRSEEEGFLLYNNLQDKYVLKSCYLEGPMLDFCNDRELGAILYWNQGILEGMY